MNRTKIPWVTNPDGSAGFTSNPVRRQCLHNCPYCYAEKIRQRYKQPAEVSFHPEELEKIRRRKKPATIFMGSMHDIFGDWVPDEWIHKIISTTQECPQHTFLFLTKNPERYANLYIPENCWLGYTDTGEHDYRNWVHLRYFKNTFVSCEPLLGSNLNINFDVIKWLIVGSLNINGAAVNPDHGGTAFDSALLITSVATISGIPVFTKPELKKMYPTLPSFCDMPYLKK